MRPHKRSKLLPRDLEEDAEPLPEMDWEDAEEVIEFGILSVLSGEMPPAEYLRRKAAVLPVFPPP